MKRKLTAWLLIGAFCLASVPEFPAHAEDPSLHMGRFNSYTQYRNAAENGILTAISGNMQASRTALPASFDLREKGLITPVRDQGSYGMCWCFSSLATLESTLVARKPLIDLSEWQLAYYAYSDSFGFPVKGTSGAADILHLGGNAYILSPILTRWVGPAAEETYSFGDFSVLDPDALPETLRQSDEYHVTDVKLLAYEQGAYDFEAQLDAIRQAVYDGHAVALSYQNRLSCYSYDDTTYYTDLADDGSSGYHSVTIVGWDDHFPASRFVLDPGRDGAWLLKNSWGTDWGDNGYFWMSYADASVTECFYLEAEPVQVHDDQYRYDDYGFWSAFSVEENDLSAYAANVFTAQEDTWLTSVMFCTALPEEDYSIQVYTGLRNSSEPDSGTASAVTEGHQSAFGYHTVDLAAPVFLKAGEDFSIVIRLSGTEGQHIACEAYMRYTAENPDGTVEVTESMLTEAMLEKDFHAGESFYSLDGKEWFDMFDEPIVDDSYALSSDDGEISMNVYAKLGNACVRGLTQKPGKVVFSEYDEALPSGTAVTLRCPGADAIWYSVNGSDMQLYTGPILITEETELSAYAVSGTAAYPVYSQQYSIQAAQLSSLLDTYSGEYLTFEALGGNVYTTTVSGSLSLLPITTGEITCDAAEFSSGSITQIDEILPAITLRVSGEGMEDSLYVLYFTEDVLGDVNLDGSLEASDAAEILIYMAMVGSGSLTEEDAPDAAWLARADYNGDGAVEASDAAAILMEIARRGSGGGEPPLA